MARAILHIRYPREVIETNDRKNPYIVRDIILITKIDFIQTLLNYTQIVIRIIIYIPRRAPGRTINWQWYRV